MALGRGVTVIVAVGEAVWVGVEVEVRVGSKVGVDGKGCAGKQAARKRRERRTKILATMGWVI